jgi:hypothetical protein
LISNNSVAQSIKLIRTTHLSHYPSASSLEFFRDNLYVIGDDAASMLILDKDHEIKDSMKLFEGDKNRISKNKKLDIESSIIVEENNKPYLLAFGSVSGPRRKQVLWIDLQDQKVSRTERFNPKSKSVEEWNVEGTALVGNHFILSNRANTTHRDNHLLVTAFDENGPNDKDLHSIKLDLPSSASVVGISSISYIKELDMLLFAASTEETSNAKDDGKIGASYIGYIRNFSKKLGAESLKPDAFVNLGKFLGSKGEQKIESVAVETQKDERLILHLAADNDNGESTIFKLSWDL